MSAGEALATTFAVTGPIDVAVDLGVGDLRVIAADRADAVVEVRPADPAKTGDVAAAARTQVDLTDSGLTVRTPGCWRLYAPPGNRPEAVHVTLNVPTGSRLRASAVFSALHVEGRLAACRFRASMGNVWLEEAGTIDVRTGAGGVAAGAVTGVATAQGVFPQRSGTGIPRRVLEDLELPRRTTGTAPQRRQMTMFIEKVVGDLGDKRRWRQYKARVKALPANYRTTVKALERYLTYFGVITKGDVPMDVLMSMLEDLADLFEQAAVDATPTRAVVGEDPVEFAETCFRNYSDGQWINKEPGRLVSAIERGIYEEIERGINKERERLVNAIGRAEAEEGSRS
jgi:DNA-binding ferritin-like protein (Dps family)